MRKYLFSLIVGLLVFSLSGATAKAACSPSAEPCDLKTTDSCGVNFHCSPNVLGGSTGSCYPASGKIGDDSCVCSPNLVGDCPVDYTCVPLYAGVDQGYCYINTEATQHIEEQLAELGQAEENQTGNPCGYVEITEGKITTEKFIPCQSPLICSYKPNSTKGTCQTAQDKAPSCTLPLLSLNITGTIACVLTNVVGGVIKAFVKLSVSILSGAIMLNQTIYGTNSLAKAGFDIVLQFVNLFFVFGILAIGFATMLKPLFPSSSLLNKINKNALPKLLLAFFFINFAFALAGMFISLSDNITKIFAQLITSSNAWNYFGSVPQPDSNVLLANVEGIGQTILIPLLTALVGIGIILVMTTIAIMFFIRWGYLTFFVIILPFTIFMEVFPIITFKKMGSLKEWSQQFTRWLLFAPVMMLFIYIVLSLSSVGLDQTTQTVFGASLGAGIGKLILQLALLVIGLQQADKLSLGGGKVIFGVASRWFEAAKKIPIREGKSLGTYLGAKTMETPQYQRVKNILASSPLTRPLAVRSDVLAAKLKKAQEKSIGEYATGYQDWSKETLIHYLNSANLSLMNPQAQTALLQQLQSKKLTTITNPDLTDAGFKLIPTALTQKTTDLNKKIGELVKAAQRIKMDKSFEKIWPHNAKNPKKVIKSLKPAEILDVVSEAFKNEEVVLALYKNQFRKMATDGTTEQKKNIEDTLIAIRAARPLGAIDPDIVQIRDVELAGLTDWSALQIALR